MKKKTSWLSVSIFSKQKDWNFILTNAIRPIIGNFIQTNHIITYAIEFNYSRGQNLRLSIMAYRWGLKKFMTALDAHFKSFLLDNKMLPEIHSLPVDGIFMPYPFNTLQYGLHKPEGLNKVGVKGSRLVNLMNEQYSFYQTLSEIIMEALGEEEINDELIVTFSYYLHLILMNCICKRYSEDLEIFWSSYDLPENKSNQEMVREFFAPKFLQNFEVLKDIRNDVFRNGNLILIESPGWIKKWEMACLHEIDQQKNFEFPKAPNINIHLNIVESINRTLGVKKNIKQLLYYFIFNTMYKNENFPI